jgi:hypothetical protein
MSFYSPNDPQFTSDYHQEVELVFSAIDCVLHREHVIYCSSELTSGLRMYEALRQHGLKIANDAFRSNLLDVNIEAAIQFAEQVRHRFHDRTIVVTPAPFSARGWTQDEYLAFWEMLLRRRIKAVWFNRNWAYSNGCTFEFAVAQDAGLPTFDESGRPLSRKEGIQLIAEVIGGLQEDGFDTAKLENNLHRLRSPHAQIDHGELEPLHRQ